MKILLAHEARRAQPSAEPAEPQFDATASEWSAHEHHENMKTYRNFVALGFTVAAVLHSLACQHHLQHSQESDPEQADLVTLWLSSWYLFFLFAWASQPRKVRRFCYEKPRNKLSEIALPEQRHGSWITVQVNSDRVERSSLLHHTLLGKIWPW